MTTGNGDRKLLLREHKEAALLHRFEAALIFAQLTVYLGATGALLKETLANGLTHASLAAIGFALIVLAIAFFFIIRRARTHMRQATDRAKVVEWRLGFRLYAARTHGKMVLSASYVAEMLCVVGGFGGIWTLLRAVPQTWWDAIGSLLWGCFDWPH
jgi:hypothetical protein